MLLSYVIRDFSSKVIAEENSEILLPPASNMKIATTYYAYKKFGPNKKFVTFFKLKGSELNIYGDPLFLVSESDLLSLVSSYISMIESVYVDNSTLSEEKYHPDWELGDLKYCYASPVEPYTVDENCRGGAHKGDEPQESLIKQVIIGERNSPPKINDSNFTIFSLERSLNDVIRHTLHVSCNFSAELLLRYTASISKGERTWNGSAEALKAFLQGIGLNSDNFEIRDGSGLSRKNLFTTQALTELLLHIISNDRDFINYFPGPGEGTLKKRLLEMKDLGIRAKTGTIGYISALSGVSLERKMVFSIIAYGKEETEAREAAIDSFLTKVVTSY